MSEAMDYRTIREIEYHACPYGRVGRIPKGTRCKPATNQPGECYFAEPWGMSMTAYERRWLDRYGFRIEPDEVERVGWRWCADESPDGFNTRVYVSAELYASKGEATWAGMRAHPECSISIMEDSEPCATTIGK